MSMTMSEDEPMGSEHDPSHIAHCDALTTICLAKARNIGKKIAPSEKAVLS